MTKRIRTHTKKQLAPQTGISLLKACGIGTALGITLLLIMAVMLSFAALKSATPSNVIRPAAMICLFACGYGGALTGAKYASSAGQNPYAGGICVFGMLIMIILIGSLFVPNGSATVWQHLLPLGVLAAACLLGSLTAALHRPSQKRQLKKLMRR